MKNYANLGESYHAEVDNVLRDLHNSSHPILSLAQLLLIIYTIMILSPDEDLQYAVETSRSAVSGNRETNDR